MGVSKVDFNGETLVDLTKDTVNENSLLAGYSAHNAAGDPVDGLAVIPTRVSQLENDAGYKTTDNDTWKANTASSEGYVAKGSGHANQVWKTDANGVPGWRADANTTYGVATTSANGLMSSGDKTKLDGIATGANKTSITNNLTATKAGTALDAVQGKVLNDKGAQMSVYKGDDGNLHFRDWSGADTVIPFNTDMSHLLEFEPLTFWSWGVTGSDTVHVKDYPYTVPKDMELLVVTLGAGYDTASSNGGYLGSAVKKNGEIVPHILNLSSSYGGYLYYDGNNKVYLNKGNILITLFEAKKDDIITFNGGYPIVYTCFTWIYGF